MTIDIPTIFVVLAMMCGLVAAVVALGWLKRDPTGRSLRAGIAGFVTSAAIGLILTRGVAPDRVSIYLANALVMLAFGIGWSAARSYAGKTAPWPVVVGGAAIWLAACAVPAVYAVTAYRAMLGSVIIAGYSVACAVEFWRAGPARRLGAQTALSVLLVVHAGFVLFRGVHVAFIAKSASLFAGDWVQGVLMIEPALALVAAALLGVGLIRERAEQELRHSAETDGLTGVLNRRAFFASAEATIARARRGARPVALVLFDLDHFKTINDHHGHLAGDQILQAFTGIITHAIRSSDLVGRIGGEEFAVLLDGVDQDRAAYIAERIRLELATARIAKGGGFVGTTVSAGVAVGTDVDFLTLFARADEALYEAKRSGRDNVRSSLPLAAAG